MGHCHTSSGLLFPGLRYLDLQLKYSLENSAGATSRGGTEITDVFGNGLMILTEIVCLCIQIITLSCYS
jgi:hypothetical protein